MKSCQGSILSLWFNTVEVGIDLYQYFFFMFFFLFSFFLTSTNIKVEWKSLSRVWLFATPCTVVHGILQARILEWVAFPFSRGSSQPRDRTHARLRNISSYSNLHRFLIHYYLDHSSRLPLLICTLLFHQWETGSRLLPSISLVIWAQYTVSQYWDVYPVLPWETALSTRVQCTGQFLLP